MKVGPNKGTPGWDKLKKLNQAGNAVVPVHILSFDFSWSGDLKLLVPFANPPRHSRQLNCYSEEFPSVLENGVMPYIHAYHHRGNKNLSFQQMSGEVPESFSLLRDHWDQLPYLFS